MSRTTTVSSTTSPSMMSLLGNRYGRADHTVESPGPHAPLRRKTLLRLASAGGAPAPRRPKHYGTIFGTLSLTSIIGRAIGPWIAGALHDRTGDYVLAFWLSIGASLVSAVAIWLAAPRKVRAVAGRVPRGL
ncbi:MAG: hypothetical protein DMD87_00445 [Candidatus Rokuibacteriota bacterium]|nr:MAG: hypothetical protein DMD87_00445 [Candidatus Rokubacteria bacterium]